MSDLHQKNTDLQTHLVVCGARSHNLKNISVSLPRGKMIVITGVSGSGKSTLAFDTIYAEGQRRYVESLSAYARQFLGMMDKPDVDSITGLSPAISIDQKTTSHNPRSTVGTVTEIHDYLRLLYARIGIPHCPECGRRIEKQSPSEITERLLNQFEGKRAILLAPVVRGRKGEYRKLFAELRREGFARVRVDGTLYELEEAEKLKLEKFEKHDVDVVVDRIVVRGSDRARIAESVETALGRSEGGLLRVLFPDAGEGGEPHEELFSEQFACPEHGSILEELEPRSFSFNNPYGACPDCSGLGTKDSFLPRLFLEETLSIREGAILPWRSQNGEIYYWAALTDLAEKKEIDLDLPWKDLPEKAKKVLLEGSHQFEGIIPNLQRRFEQTASDFMRQKLAEFMEPKLCPTCQGTRYKPEILAVTVGGLNIAEVAGLSVLEARAFFARIHEDWSEWEGKVAQPIVKATNTRLQFLIDVGLDYLSLDRTANTLSGGEAQRIRLATQVGSGLTGVLYVLDEPSIGLHPKDNTRLIATLKNLRDLGNTLLIVEHDEETILEADYLVDMGLGAGIHGGEIIAEGTPNEVAAHPHSLTGKYLRGELKIEVPKVRRKGTGQWIEINGATENNLQNVDLRIPLGMMTVVTGASGSGKSTLITGILHAALAKALNGSKKSVGAYGSLKGLEYLDKVIQIDQSPIGRTPRSNPATYTGVFNEIRELFTKTTEARKRGYQAGRFSFNVKGGRCEHCKGDGVMRIEMNFLPDIYIPCDVCKGKRYNRETLEVKYNDKTIADVLEMTVEEAFTFFESVPAIARKMQLLLDVGLGYMKIGQTSTTLSGGEAQRIKLATELAKRATGKTIYILDEPTTGLHFEDVSRLMNVLQRLVDNNNTLVVIEHNLDVMKVADWIVDMGPEGGVRGGTIVATGTPEQIAAHPNSYTGAYLACIEGIIPSVGTDSIDTPNNNNTDTDKKPRIKEKERSKTASKTTTSKKKISKPKPDKNGEKSSNKKPGIKKSTST